MAVVNTLSSHATDDNDLVELAGYHSYVHYDIDEVFKVNEKKFRVIDTIYNTDTGLDALTVQNVKTRELTVVFVGSEQMDTDWIGTNTKLLSDAPPAQVREAVAYFEHINDEVGEVSSVSGNSLAGALTNAVGIDNPGVKAVTLNPAILPAGMVDPDKEYANITNYYSKFDFLTGTEETIKMGDRIPGKKYGINNGVPSFSMLGSNHTGYIKQDANGEFTLEIGIEGEPGHGFVHIGADDHIVTSLWTGAPLYEGQSERIEMNQENMMLLSHGIRDNVKGRLGKVREYVGNSVRIVHTENEKFNQRVIALQDAFQQKFEETAGEPVFMGITTTGFVMKACIDELIRLLDKAEDKCRILNNVLNSKPVEIVEYITSVNLSVETLFDAPKEYLEQLKADIDDLVASVGTIISNEIPELFKGGKDLFVDAVVGELDAHYDILEKNKESVYKQLQDYERQVQDIADTFHDKDASIAGAIQTSASPTDGIGPVQKTALITLEPSPYLKVGMKIKEIQVQMAHNQINTLGMTVLMPILISVKTVLTLIEAALDAIILAVNAVLTVGIYGNPVSLLISLFTDYEQKIKNAVQEVLEPIIEMETSIEGIRLGMDRMIINLPEMLSNFKPYIDTAIFEPGKFSDVRLYNVSALAVLDDMEVLFEDITFQLSGQKAMAIEATLEISKNVLGNIQLLKEQVNRGTL
ncbi:MAG: SA1320 family protein [Peribacillus sp.]